MSSTASSSTAGSGDLSALILLWLAGTGLRITLLAVPPLIPLIHSDLHLSETEIGTLGTLPSLLLAAVAIPGSLLIARCGARMALVIGLLLVAFVPWISIGFLS